jgi:hypothetical protein
MAKIKVRQQREITLLRDICDALNLREGDHLEAEVVEGGVFCGPSQGPNAMLRGGARKRRCRGSNTLVPNPSRRPIACSRTPLSAW